MHELVDRTNPAGHLPAHPRSQHCAPTCIDDDQQQLDLENTDAGAR